MKVIDLKGIDSTVLFRYLEINFSNVLTRFWPTDKTTVGIFVVDPDYPVPKIGVTFNRATIFAECNEETLECSLWVTAAYVQRYFYDETHRILAVIKDFAEEKGWVFVERPWKYIGKRCPYCGAIYVYPKTGLVSCQNCGREFDYHPDKD